jgi:DNA (cytosine-5)-methyltransferase 1
MSLGLREACRALGERLEVVMAADSNQVAAEVYRAFHPGTEVETQPIETWLDGELGAKPTKQEQALKERLGDVTIVMGGPPCQGHSNLNNHTRRQDPKNELYARMARFAEVVGPDHVIIENVPEVNRDRGGVMDLTCEALRENGYVVHSARLKAENFGVAQQRHRMFVVASRTGPLCHAPLEALLSRHQVTQPRSVLWAINDLVDSSHGSGFDACSVPQPLTQRRIEWYFQAENEDKYELPKEHRPACHLEHLSYGAVYGRMRPDQPAPTITTGFMTMGQGRFVHPSRPRTLTPHEGARVQFLPDWLGFPDDLFRKDYRLLIGNAVPPKLTYAVGVQLLG